MKSLIILFLLILSLKADKLPDISSKWKCEFTVNNSGDEPLGNFFPCREKGCNEDAYAYHNKPKTYKLVKNFIVNFETKTIKYDWDSVKTLRESNKDKEPIYYINNKRLKASFDSDLMDDLINYKGLKTEKKQDKNGRTLVFIHSSKEHFNYLLSGILTHVESKFNIDLNQKFSYKKKSIDVLKINFLVQPFKRHSLKKIHSLTFYGDKVLWVNQFILPFSKTLATVNTAYGNCTPIK